MRKVVIDIDSFDKSLLPLYLFNLFQTIFENQNVSLMQVNVFTTMLMKYDIPFETSYTGATRKENASVQITVYINPSTTIAFNLSL